VYTERKTVFVVDDDPSIRAMVDRMLVSSGYECRTFGSATELLECPTLELASCLVLDVCLPDLNGLELQQRLLEHKPVSPIVFITGYGDIPTTVKAMQQGAIDFLAKPFERGQLLDAVQTAIGKHVQQMQQIAEYEDILDRVGELTPRETQVFGMVSEGLMNREIAAELGTSEQTVKLQRGKVMKKMEAGSLADLVRLYERYREAREAMAEYDGYVEDE
jgi:FixJ family two-component response regulator